MASRRGSGQEFGGSRRGSQVNSRAQSRRGSADLKNDLSHLNTMINSRRSSLASNFPGSAQGSRRPSILRNPLSASPLPAEGPLLSMGKSLSSHPSQSGGVLRLPDPRGASKTSSAHQISASSRASPLPERRVSILTVNTEIGGPVRERKTSFLETPSMVDIVKEDAKESDKDSDDETVDGHRRSVSSAASALLSGTQDSSEANKTKHKPGPVPSNLKFAGSQDRKDKAWSDCRSRLAALQDQVREVCVKQREVLQWLETSNKELGEMKLVARSVCEEIEGVKEPERRTESEPERRLSSGKEPEPTETHPDPSKTLRPQTKLYREPLFALDALSQDAHDLLLDIRDVVEQRLGPADAGGDIFCQAMDVITQTKSKANLAGDSDDEDDGDDESDGSPETQTVL